MATTAHQPALRAFSVIKRERRDDFWLPIRAAVAHQNGDGFNVILQALPIPDGDGVCKVVLRRLKDEEPSGSQEQNGRNNKSGSRRRYALHRTKDH